MSEYAFEIKQKTKIKISIYGKEYELHRPTVDEAEIIATKDSNSSSLDGAKKFMATLGLPIDVSGQMEVEHFNLLLEAVLDFNKKK
jgi:hypothetical protein